jgi:hypothetical protein
MELRELRHSVLLESYDPIRLWELQAAFPEVPLEQLRTVVIELLASQLIELVPTNKDDGDISPADVRVYVDDDTQWLNTVENPWPQRGAIYELIATEPGRAAPE